MSQYSHKRKTKIVATLGPATDGFQHHAPTEGEVLRQLLLAGMDVARMNMSHQDPDTHRRRAEALRRLRRELEVPAAMLVDTRGPEIRVGALPQALTLTRGQRVALTGEAVTATARQIPVSFPAFAEEVPVGARILIDDGRLELEAAEKTGGAVDCLVVNGGVLRSGKGVCVPGAALSIPFLSDRDRADLSLACEMGADIVAASFTRTAADVELIRQELRRHGGEHIRVVAKIENAEGVNHLDEILRVADGLMIARGDMGMEFPMEELPAIQKSIIQKSYSAGVSVITATQMLDSMITSPRPTRAEVCDVAGAVYDGASAVMLSGETAAGQYPVEAVAAMARIAAAAESHIDYRARFTARAAQDGDSITEAIAAAGVQAAHRLNAHAIVTFSRTGRAARALAKYRPACPILCVTPNAAVQRQEMLTWGVTPLLLPVGETSPADPLEAALRAAEEAGWMPGGSRVVTVIGSPFDAVKVVQTS